MLDTGAKTNLARLCLLGNRKLLLGKRGLLRESTDPECARSKFGDGRLGEVGSASGMTVGIAGCRS